MTVQEAIDYLNTHTWSKTKLGLERTRALLSALGDPQKALKFVHVTGSNGKGSFCAMLERIFREAGYTTGLFTSPHLNYFGERIQVNGRAIPPSALAKYTAQVAAAADALPDHPTQFELTTAIGMLYFAARSCDIVLLEVGMGGALDSTNAIDAPQLAVMMNVGLEHTEYLGSTLEAIAQTKAGIIKPGCACVLYESDPAVTAVVQEVCAERDVSLTISRPGDVRVLSSALTGQDILWKGQRYALALPGPHQSRNAAAVLEAVHVLRTRGWDISEKAVKAGLLKVHWPARFEVLRKRPPFILDGGHNPQCAEAIADTLISFGTAPESVVFLTGILADKDYGAVYDALLPFARAFVCLTPDSSRAMPAAELAQYLTGRGKYAVAATNAEEGIAFARALAGNDPVIAFGSLYMAGEIRAQFKPRTARSRADESNWG